MQSFLSSCNFVWDRLNHDEIRQYFGMKKVTNVTTMTEREEANEYLNNLRRYENGERNEFQEALQELDENEIINLADDVIAEVANERGAFAAAQHIVNNPAGVNATTFFQDVIARSSHPNGPSWSIPYNKDMRLHDALSQRSVNTRINPQIAREVGGVDTSTTYSAPFAAAAAAVSVEYGDSMSGLSASPIPPPNFNAFPVTNTNAPEHLSTLRDRLMEYSMKEEVDRRKTKRMQWV